MHVAFALALLPLAEASVFADDRVNYEQHIKPLLRGRCVTCHGALRQRGKLRLDTVGMMLKGGDSGPVLHPSDDTKSLIVQRITATDKADRMPPEGDPLSVDEIKLLKNWIAQGAKAPSDEKAERDPKLHWAYKKPQRAKLPKANRDAWNAHPIDAFVGRMHDQNQLVPNTLANKSTLLRRIYLDLIGLPPTRKQLDDFLANDSNDAYAKVVDELLKSPHYGERWGRHWMDVWRYSDWYGYRAELRNSARHMWRWRDWIVESLNEDKPYDQMIVEMLAADEVSPEDRDSLRATGFLARHYYKFNRNTWMETAIEHTGKAFLGLTFNCARCHDHMYDPISQKEYYQFRAIFAPYQVRTEKVAEQTDVTKDGLSIAYDLNLSVKTFLFVRGNDKYPDKENPLDPTIPAFFTSKPLLPKPVEQPVEFWYPGLRKDVQTSLINIATAKIAAAQAELEKARQSFSDLVEQQKKQTAAQDALKPKPIKPEKTETKPAPLEISKPFLVDDFSKKQPHWEFGEGKWEFKAGNLIQSMTGAQRRSLTSKIDHPQDFSATFRVKILGGETWKSVGLSFDSSSLGFQSVYISAYAGGPKVQYSYQANQKIVYPPSATTPTPIKLGQVHELRVDVRGDLANVLVDGKRLLVFKLAIPRRTGRFVLWTFDANAEFHNIEVKPLAANAKLVETSDSATSPVIDIATNVSIGKARLNLAEARLRAAQAQLTSLTARTAAETSKYVSIDSSETGKRKLAELSKLAAAADLNAQIEAATEKSLDIAVKTIEAQQNKKLVGKPKADALAKLKKDAAATVKSLATLKEKAKTPGSNYAPLSEQYPKISSGRRTVLARWIASKDNPLTARVAVNHIWMRHFGEPLVSSVFDFGMNGKSPSHPDLLDWLAVELVENGWSMKHIHRLIVTSRAYRMSSKAGNAHNLKIDPDNHHLWRTNTRRMESEVVRDCILAVSDKLDRRLGGPEADASQGQSTFRRSLYYRHAPEKLMAFLELFDTASTDECYRRSDTIAPQQALALVNSRLALEQSRLLAAKLSKEITDAKQIDEIRYINELFRIVLTRSPHAKEVDACVRFLEQQATQLATPAALSKFNLGPSLSVSPAKDPRQRARENLVHVLLNHNDFVTVR
jgi:hypothetical protein